MDIATAQRPAQPARITEPKPLGAVAIECRLPVVTLALKEILKEEAEVVYEGTERPPGIEEPSCIVVACASGGEVDRAVKRLVVSNQGSSILVFGMRDDPQLARRALLTGASGFLHAGMRPRQIARAVRLASERKNAVPQGPFKNETPTAQARVAGGLADLTPRQQEIMELVCEGLSNAKIAERLFLAESTVKQHLYAAYRLLNVRNRVQAAKLMRSA